MNLLLVGDMHVVPEEVEDSQGIMDLVEATIGTETVDAVVFLGDQHHNHALVRVEVMEFWYRNLVNLSKQKPIILLRGNHDASGDASVKGHALLTYSRIPGVEVIDSVRPSLLLALLHEYILFAPYFADKEQFVKAVNDLNPFEGEDRFKTLICHQTFDGSRYENGFFASDGVDQNLLDFEYIYSGHIHEPQEFGKVKYIGAPRWRSASDANVNRHIALVKFEKGVPVKSKLIETWKHCTPLESTVLIEPAVFESNWKWLHSKKTVTVVGFSDYVSIQKRVIEEDPSVKIRLSIKEHSIKVRESEGIIPALERFMDGYIGRFGTPNDILAKTAKERLDGIRT